MTERMPEDPYAPDPDRPLTSAARPWWRWLFLVPGIAAVGWGAVGLMQHRADVPLMPWLTWFVGGVLVHDLLVAPLVVAVGALLTRLLPTPARAPIVVGLVVSAMLAVISILFVLNPGRPQEPGFLPLDYARNLTVLVGATMLVAVVWAAVATRRSRAQSG